MCIDNTAVKPALHDGGAGSIILFGMKPETGRWVVLILGAIMQVCLGSVYGWSVFALPLKLHYAQNGVTLGQMEINLPFLVLLGSFALMMPVAGRLYVNRNPLPILLCGSILVGAGWLLSGLIIGNASILGRGSFPLLVISYGMLTGAGVGVCYGGPIAAAARWFPDRKGLAVGFSVFGFGVSMAVLAPLADYLIQKGSITHAFSVLGAVLFITLSAISLFMRFPPAEWKPRGWVLKAAVAGGSDMKPSLVYRTARFWTLWVCFLIGSTVGLMAIGISKTVAVDQDYIALTNAQATFAVSFFGLPSGIGRILFGWLADRITPRYTAVIAFALAALGSVGMLLADQGDFVLFILSFSLIWMTFGGWLSLAPTATGTFWGARRQPEIYGMVFTAYGIGAILGNLLSGVTKDVFSGYRFAFYPILAMASLGILIALIGLRRRPTPCTRGMAQEI
jgi:OFA family oxalate/formate antiporter-like MFS transporter